MSQKTEWKRICAGFISFLNIFVLSLDIHLSTVKSWYPVNQFYPITLLFLSNPVPGFPTPNVVLFLYSVVVRCVLVDHHCMVYFHNDII